MLIDESRTAKGFTPAAQVPAVFGAPRTLDGIVIHHWGEMGQSHDGVVNFFCSTGPGETSAHFVVSGGRINCIVSPEDAAWHCPGKNASHIGIECRPEASDADYQAVAWLVSWLRATYNRPLPLSRHRDWYSTACPGAWDLTRIDRLAAPIPLRSTKGPFMALTDKQQTDLLEDVAFIRSELEAINTSSGQVRFRDFFVQGVRAAQTARDILLKK